MIDLPKILPAPKRRPSSLPHSSKWLSGEGAGSWFLIEECSGENCFKVSRFSPEGILECEGLFVTESHFDPAQGFELTYPSHCAVVTVIQFAKTIVFKPNQPGDNEESKV